VDGRHRHAFCSLLVNFVQEANECCRRTESGPSIPC
jgi:hypothetical protein